MLEQVEKDFLIQAGREKNLSAGAYLRNIINLMRSHRKEINTMLQQKSKHQPDEEDDYPDEE